MKEEEKEQPAKEEEEEEPMDEEKVEENEEFEFVEEKDDETTLIEEEQLGRDIPVEKEIALLEEEAEMDIEQLRAMYAKMEEEENGGMKEEEKEQPAKEEEEGQQPPSKKTKKKPFPSPKSSDADDALAQLAALDARARSMKVTRPFTMAPSLKLREVRIDKERRTAGAKRQQVHCTTFLHN